MLQSPLTSKHLARLREYRRYHLKNKSHDPNQLGCEKHVCPWINFQKSLTSEYDLILVNGEEKISFISFSEHEADPKRIRQFG